MSNYPPTVTKGGGSLSYLANRSTGTNMSKNPNCSIKSLEELLNAGDSFRVEDVSPELMTLTIKIHGDQFESSITGEIAKAIGLLQTSLYRAAAEILHGEPNINRLTAEEKDQFEIVVHIRPGCSELKIPGNKYLFPLIEKMVEKMDSKHIAIVACVALGGFTGYQITQQVVDGWKATESTKALVEQAKVLSSPINGAVQSAGVNLAKAAKNADSLQIGDRKFGRQEIEILNKRAERQAAQFETYQGECLVLGIRKVGMTYKVDLLDESLGETFSATLPPSGLFDQKMPAKPTDLAPLIESDTRVSVTVLIKETKAKTDRFLIDLEIMEDEDVGK